jgi:hypothetical protein
MNQFREDIRQGLKDFYPLALVLYGIWENRDPRHLLRRDEPKDYSKVVQRLDREKRELVTAAQNIITGGFVSAETIIAAESILAVASPWDGLDEVSTELHIRDSVRQDGTTRDEWLEQLNAVAAPSLPPSSFQEFIPFANLVQRTWNFKNETALRTFENKKSIFELALQAIGDIEHCCHQDYLGAKLIVAVARTCEWPVNKS